MQCFRNVFEKTSTSMFLTMFFKMQNIVQTMHLTMLIAHPYQQFITNITDKFNSQECNLLLTQTTRLTTAKCHRYIYRDWAIDMEKANEQMRINLASFVWPVEDGSEVQHVPHNHRNLNNSDWKQCKTWKFWQNSMDNWTSTLSAALYSNTLLIVSLKKMFKIKFYIIM